LKATSILKRLWRCLAYAELKIVAEPFGAVRL
jgi:hypothetical protein